MMNDDIEFTTRSKERALQHWEEHMRGREGAQRLLLDAPGDDENDNDSGPAPARLYRRHLLIHEALEESTGNELVKASTSVQSSTAGPANDSFNRATATQPPKANYDDDLVSWILVEPGLLPE